MRFLSHRRLPFASIALACLALLGYGYYLQFHDGLEPCPLCVFQRVCFMAVGAIALIAAAHGGRFRPAAAYCGLVFLGASTGAGIAGRQVWLQHLPADRVPECGPGLDFLLEMYPLTETIRTVLRGSGDCAKVDWTFLGLSIAEWSLLCFLGLAILSCAILYARFAQRTHRHRGGRRRRGDGE
ncbi:MAG: disulfide bond formation protein B [Gammaproteobacteria bacterium]